VFDDSAGCLFVTHGNECFPLLSRNPATVRKILIVDDNASFRRSLKAFLCDQFAHFAIAEAENGASAMRTIDLARPDLIFMDIKLPGENGLVLTRKIKTIYSPAIVILTSYDAVEYREAASACGADYFLAKDAASAAEVSRLVESYLPGSSSSPPI
jgi:DNA-binding NarL/FixJ family response regulator